jgi:hypothetical protein
MIRVSYAEGPGDEQPPAPTWQQQMYGLWPESIAEQGELFPGFQELGRTRRPQPDVPGQAQLFK